MGFFESVAPRYAVKRARARIELQRYRVAEERTQKAFQNLRKYDAASKGRRMSGWLATDDGPPGANAFVLSILRDRSRDLANNNPWMANALDNIESEVVGDGITPKIKGSSAIKAMWKEWAETTQCDADGRLNFYGIQQLAIRSIMESGEVLIRRRWRSRADGLAIPMQLQVIEPDLLADDRAGFGERDANIRAGIAFDRKGNRVAYHLYKDHPTNLSGLRQYKLDTVRVPASEVIHIYRMQRPGQIRGVPWAAPSITRLKLLDDYEDAALERARVAACFAAFVVEPDSVALPLKQVDEDGNPVQQLERLEPGIVEHLTPGRDVRFGKPPSDGDYEKVILQGLMAAGAGMNIPYQLFTGDVSKANFSSTRAGRITYGKTINKWRWNMLIPHLCDGAFRWFLEAAAVETPAKATVTWTPPRTEMVDPTKETAANKERVRSGFASWAEVVREQGQDPDEVLAEIAEYNAKFDELGIVLDTDPRTQSSAGQKQGSEDDDTSKADDSGESDSESDDDDDAGADPAAEAAE